MMGFEAASWLWLALPVFGLWWLFAGVQRRALAWLDENVAPRFRARFSIYGRRSLWLHLSLLLLMALALVMAAAGPFARGKTEAISTSGRLLLLVDGSASMWAEDVEPVEPEAAEPTDRSLRRIDIARSVATGLMRELEGYRFALASFSGTSAIHLPMTDNRPLVEEALATLEVHSYYRNTGSSLAGALDVVSHFVDRRGYRLQVVLLSDGEQPTPEDTTAALAALAAQDVPVHTVAIGSTEGQARRILNFQDVVDKVESPRVLREYHTKRVDEHLERVSKKTGGSFFVAQVGVTDQLARDVLRAGGESEPFEHDAARTDLSGRYLLVFLVGLLFDTLWFGRKPRHGGDAFDLNRLGPSSRSPKTAWTSASRVGGRTAAVVLTAAAALTAACSLPLGTGEGGSLRKLAHRENERGIVKDLGRDHGRARTHYERSKGYGFESQIPAYNLARSVLLTGDYSEAHDLFQEALLLAPDLEEAHFNDAMTLFLWGQAERDPKNCDLERTRELWTQALRRFSSAISADEDQGSGSDSVAQRARDNRRALFEEIEALERLIAEPPEECFSQSSQSSASGAGEGESEDQEETGEDEDEGSGSEGSGSGGGESSQDEEEAPSAQAPTGAGENQGANAGSQDAPAELSEDELGEIREQLARLAEQSREEGKYHRRTLPEQFRKEDWTNPEATIWW